MFLGPRVSPRLCQCAGPDGFATAGPTSAHDTPDQEFPSPPIMHNQCTGYTASARSFLLEGPCHRGFIPNREPIGQHAPLFTSSELKGCKSHGPADAHESASDTGLRSGTTGAKSRAGTDADGSRPKTVQRTKLCSACVSRAPFVSIDLVRRLDRSGPDAIGRHQRRADRLWHRTMWPACAV